MALKRYIWTIQKGTYGQYKKVHMDNTKRYIWTIQKGTYGQYKKVTYGQYKKVHMDNTKRYIWTIQKGTYGQYKNKCTSYLYQLNQFNNEILACIFF